MAANAAEDGAKWLTARYEIAAAVLVPVSWMCNRRSPRRLKTGMAALIVLLASWLALRAAGGLGISPLRTWRQSAVYALAVMFVFTASAHFNKLKYDLARMIPSGFPQPLLLVYITGVLEFLGAIGLVFSPSRRLAGICLAVMLVGLFAANVNAASQGVTLGGRPATRLWLRAPMQAFFIWLLWWSTKP